MSPALYWSWAQIRVGHHKHCPGEVGSKDFERTENLNLGQSNSQAMSPVHLPSSLPLSADPKAYKTLESSTNNHSDKHDGLSNRNMVAISLLLRFPESLWC